MSKRSRTAPPRSTPFTVAAVVSAEPHPNADRLKLCVVDTGKGQVQVVCGAPNARAGMKGVFAPAGTVIPRTGALLKESAIRGVASRGMLCSAYELGLGDDHDGIIELRRRTRRSVRTTPTCWGSATLSSTSR